MKNISDIIEEFILEQLTDGEINLSRNELAGFFNCAPSQINYVLTTRFTPMKGFDIVSRRGGGGYVKVMRLSSSDADQHLQTLMNLIEDSIDYNAGVQILENLFTYNYITEREFKLLRPTIAAKSLSAPVKIEDNIRAKVLKNILIELLKGGN